MSHIFISHSSADNAEAIALRDWLISQGWSKLFLDLDPERGLKAGERWQGALKQAAEYCESVIFLISPAWAASKWCLAEFLFASNLNKQIFGVIVEPTPFDDLPAELTAKWMLTDVTTGTRDVELSITLPGGDTPTTVAFSSEGLDRLRIGLMQSGLDPRYFAWPPKHDPQRAPYRGLRPFEAEDAGIFFGRDGQIVVGTDLLRGLRESPPPRLVVILGASGSGKSSYMRAGLLPRVARDDQHFLVLPVIRPERAVISGKTGLLASLEAALKKGGLAQNRSSIRKAITAGVTGIAPVLKALVDTKTPVQPADRLEARKPPTIILPIDQAEELFLPDGGGEASAFLELLGDLLAGESPAMIALFTIRSDQYEPLQTNKRFEGMRQHILSLPPISHGAYAEVIKGPALRLERSDRALTIEEPLVDALLGDIEEGGGKDALPLLAFTLERLYQEHGGDGDLKLEEYRKLGGVKGSIEAAIEQALNAADANEKIPKDRQARLLLLRRGFIPWLAGIDPDTGAPRRSVARLSEIPAEARPLIELLVEQRLLIADVSKDAREAMDAREAIIEPAHEALLRQWDLLRSWLVEDTALLSVLEGIRRASRDWDANKRGAAWLTHRTDRLANALKLRERRDLSAKLTPTDWDYLTACQEVEVKYLRKARHVRASIGLLVLLLVIVGAGWWKQDLLYAQYHWHFVMKPTPLQAEKGKEMAATGSGEFAECKNGCPTMVVVPAGTFTMGSPRSVQNLRFKREQLQHEVTIGKPFAVAKYELTFDEWDACANSGPCNSRISSKGWGRGPRPAIHVTWYDAQAYVKWLSRMTGQHYRLLTEAEWEYVARANTTTDFSFQNGENIDQYAWYGKSKTNEVGKLKVNAFGLKDMHGNVYEWVADCFHDNYYGAPSDGSAWASDNCRRKVVRGGAWLSRPLQLRSAARDWRVIDKGFDEVGFRVARTLE